MLLFDLLSKRFVAQAHRFTHKQTRVLYQFTANEEHLLLLLIMHGQTLLNVFQRSTDTASPLCLKHT